MSKSIQKSALKAQQLKINTQIDMKNKFKKQIIIEWLKILAIMLIAAFMIYLALNENVFIIGI